MILPKSRARPFINDLPQAGYRIMAVPQDQLVAQIDDLLKRLDAVKLAPVSIFKADINKEYYESLLMFSFRKLQAVRYHRERVNQLLAKRDAELDARKAEAQLPAGHVGWELTSKLSYSAGEFSHELCAFFAAIRSALDFLARLCSQHTTGTTADSISTFLKLIEKKNSGPILDLFKPHLTWLADVRDYRDHIVHRLCLVTMTGGEINHKDGVSVMTPYPIVVPVQTPQHVPDTRRARYLDDPNLRFMRETSEAVATDIDGNKKLLKREIKIHPAPGYISIEDLMDREVTGFESFFSAIVEGLIKLNFKPSAVQKPPKKM